jgi:hypothetical protein
MQTRLLIALSAGALVVLAAFWQLHATPESVRPRIPSRMDVDEQAAAGISPLESDFAPLRDPAELPLSEPPPAPAVNNNPARGTLWLRVIDADTNRPLADTHCPLLRTNGYNFEPDERQALPARTDALGMIELDALVVESTDGDPWAEVVVWSDYHEVGVSHLPVPRGWYFPGSVYDFNQAILELLEKPSRLPLDVRVRRTASVRITLRDRYGLPVPHGMLAPTLLMQDDYAFEWLRSFGPELELASPEGWASDARDLRQDIRVEFIKCELIGGGVAEEPRYPWMDEEGVAANQFGSLDLTGLPCTSLGVLAWHPRYGLATASARLQSGHNNLDVYFRDDLAGELRVKVLWPDGPDGVDDLSFELMRTGPEGLPDAIATAPDWWGQSWYFTHLPGAACELLVSGVPPGWLHLSVEDEDGYRAGMALELAPGESRVVTLHLGEGAMAAWTPVIRSGGVQLAEAPLFLTGGEMAYRDLVVVQHDPREGTTEALELSPGHYTAWLPTLDPFHFTLSPGQKRTDIFELLSLNVNMTIGLDLARLLGDPEEGARLDLYPTGIWRDSLEHLYALDDVMRGLDADYDLLLPGVVRGWKLPPGTYKWELHGATGSIDGRVTFTPEGPKSLHFGLASLPGYEVLDVTLIGFASDDPGEVYFEPSMKIDTAVYPGKPGGLDFPGEYASEELAVGPGHALKVSDTRWLVYAPRGRQVISVWNSDSGRDFHVTVPGRNVISASEIGEQGFRTLTLRSHPGDDEGEWSELMFDDYDIELTDGQGWMMKAWADSEEPVPPGPFSVRVTRERYHEAGGSSLSFTVVEFGKGSEPLELDLWKLACQPAAKLNLSFKGRGSPEAPLDAWWFDGEGPRVVGLIALDDGARPVALPVPSRYMPDGKLEFAFEGLCLPAGRYRVIPWPGAPEKYLREFTLQSGVTTTIVVQGG